MYIELYVAVICFSYIILYNSTSFIFVLVDDIAILFCCQQVINSTSISSDASTSESPAILNPLLQTATDKRSSPITFVQSN